eukprot:TRINITY_DN45058_c0_g1_i3.p2 TRINITY_DN45058_c0_g1~~TRINITY_DN45058_c0_g1_i3.p2  ORF type:complete len:139 (-),score=17.72 TRINITY_DN45058_c0_g1_i3:1099-1515(-)
MFTSYLKNKIPENHNEMRKANVQSNITVAQAKTYYWSSFCTKEISDHKDYQKVWNKMREMKNGISLPNCPIETDSQNMFPSDIEKAEIFVEMFAQNSKSEGLAPPVNLTENKKRTVLYTQTPYHRMTCGLILPSRLKS